MLSIVCSPRTPVHRRRAARVLIATFLLLFVILPGFAEEAGSSNSRPRTALVLSGGGARGAAHVGVLKVLEEQRVPVDFVVGTSMGAIAGGMYSAGLSPDQMEQALRDIDWSTAFIDRPDRNKVAFRIKEDDFVALAPFEFGYNRRDGISRQAGFVNGQKINIILRSLVVHAANVENFDELNLPFRSVTVDLETGEIVVLERGELAMAIRASMAVPGVFTPVEIDDRVLIDGGVLMNLPIEVALQMGAERIIAVDVGDPPGEIDGTPSYFDVIGQTLALLLHATVEDQLELLRPQDLLITPALGDLSTADFTRLIEGVDIGEQSAREVIDALQEFSVSEAEYARFLEQQRTPPERFVEPIIVEDVVVTGVERTNPEFLSRSLKAEAGKPLTEEVVYRDLERIQQLGEFQSVDARLEVDDDGKRTLVYAPQEKSWGPTFFKAGTRFETNFDGASEAAGVLNIRRSAINRRGGEFKAILTAGDPLAADLELFQPLFGSAFYFFVAPNLFYEREETNRFLPGGDVELTQSDFLEAGLDVGVQLRNWGELRLGARRGTIEGDSETAADLESVEIDFGAWRAAAVIDQVNNPFFPTRGAFMELEGFFATEDLGSDFDYDRLFLDAYGVATRGRHTLFAGGQFGTDLGSDLPFLFEFQLGGFLALSGLDVGEIQGDEVALGTLGYLHRLIDLDDLGTAVYAGVFAQAGQVDGIAADDLLYSGTVFLGVNTVLAPIYLAYGATDGEGSGEVYFFIGNPFRGTRR